MKPLLELGYVARAHGIRGEVGVRSFDPASETLLDVERIVLRLRGSAQEVARKIESARPTPQGILLVLDGVDSRSAAEALVGATVLVHREDLAPPAEGEYFQGDLIGLSAVDEQGGVLGQVEEVWETGPVPNLVIRGAGIAGDGELVVPFVDEFVPVVDMPGRRIVVRPPVYEEA